MHLRRTEPRSSWLFHTPVLTAVPGRMPALPFPCILPARRRFAKVPAVYFMTLHILLDSGEARFMYQGEVMELNADDPLLPLTPWISGENSAMDWALAEEQKSKWMTFLVDNAELVQQPLEEGLAQWEDTNASNQEMDGAAHAENAANTIKGVPVAEAQAGSASESEDASKKALESTGSAEGNASTKEHPMTVFVQMPLVTTRLFEKTLAKLGESGVWHEAKGGTVRNEASSSICADDLWTRPQLDRQLCANVKDGGFATVRRYGYCEAIKSVRPCRYVTLLREPLSQMIAAYNMLCLGCERGSNMCIHAPGACPTKSMSDFAAERDNLITRTMAGALPEGKDLLEGYYEDSGFRNPVTEAHFHRAQTNLNSSKLLALPAEDFAVDRKSGQIGNYRKLLDFVGDLNPKRFLERQYDQLPSGDFKPSDTDMQRMKRALKFDMRLYWAVATRQWPQ